MADTSHLERMGRELKCPICLSLLNSAVSLVCNHVFCNSCIEKSMKSVSSCPVCKVPFRRREIRPAPHMDSLVSIYRSMEVASGVNIFVTQNAPSIRFPGYDNQRDGYEIGGLEENSKTCIENVQENQKGSQKKGRTRLSKATSKSSSLNAVKPSFPTKKRVHVPQYLPSETPTQCVKSIDDHDAATEPKRDSNMQKDNVILNENGEPAFTPFFWLRDDEDAEKLSQKTDGDFITETPPEVPCFSDIKGSDDEAPCKSSPNREACVATSDADFFDSEMFEWTQRPCSPELHTSPVKEQVKNTNGKSLDKNKHVSPDATTVLKSGFRNSEIMINGEECHEAHLVFSSSPRDKIVNRRRQKSNKRVREAVGKRQNKRAKRTDDETSEAPEELEEEVGIKKQKTLDNNGNACNLMKKSCKRKKKMVFDAKGTEAASADIAGLSGGTNPLMPDSNNVFADASVLSDKKTDGKGSNFKKIDKISRNISLLRKSACKSKATKLNAAEDATPQGRNEHFITCSPKKSNSAGKHLFDRGVIIRKCQVTRAKKKNLKKAKFPEDNFGQSSHPQGISGKVATNNIQNIEVLQVTLGSTDSNDLQRVEDVPHLSESFVKEHETNFNKILCAFCKSAEESEVTGSMVHYLEGKPVADQTGGTNIIHSHKNCTEWAPNVFFQDDKAINLESELTRSRRIKCCFCGIKGAALGCYDKSCRKSFHVPCAKMTPECRWDYDNFVMLCPRHSTSKLPCEEHRSQSNKKRKSDPKRSSHIHDSKFAKDENKACLRSKSFNNVKNLVLCCSGLTDVEKGCITEFERISGVKVLKNWDQSVTHIIASTDEKGACKRTLKFLMGVLEGKWILTIEWVKDSMKAMEFVDEQHYEIKVDVHGIRDGPSLGRLRLSNKKPKLFNGYKFYFMGEFVPSYKRYLHDLVIAAGGTVLNRRPISGDQEKSSSGCSTSPTFIIYSLELPEKCEPRKINSIFNQRHMEAEALASSTGTMAASNSWILNSIAGCKLQRLTK